MFLKTSNRFMFMVVPISCDLLYLSDIYNGYFNAFYDFLVNF